MGVLRAAVPPRVRPAHRHLGPFTGTDRGLLVVHPERDAAGQDAEPLLLVRVHMGRCGMPAGPGEQITLDHLAVRVPSDSSPHQALAGDRMFELIAGSRHDCHLRLCQRRTGDQPIASPAGAGIASVWTPAVGETRVCAGLMSPGCPEARFRSDPARAWRGQACLIHSLEPATQPGYVRGRCVSPDPGDDIEHRQTTGRSDAQAHRRCTHDALITRIDRTPVTSPRGAPALQTRNGAGGERRATARRPTDETTDACRPFDCLAANPQRGSRQGRRRSRGEEVTGGAGDQRGSGVCAPSRQLVRPAAPSVRSSV